MNASVRQRTRKCSLMQYVEGRFCCLPCGFPTRKHESCWTMQGDGRDDTRLTTHEEECDEACADLALHVVQRRSQGL